MAVRLPGGGRTVEGDDPYPVALDAIGALSPTSPSVGLPTIGSYIEAFSPIPLWRGLCSWPPDVFALCNLVLDHTEAYRFAVAPPAGRRWPPDRDWNRMVTDAAREWQVTANIPDSGAPRSILRLWDTIGRNLSTPLETIRRGEAALVHESLITLHAMADEACSGLAAMGLSSSTGAFEQRAWRLLSDHGSLSRLSAARVRVTPKSHFAARGVTIRSFSRYLALMYESVEVQWRRIEAEPPSRNGTYDRRDFNLVLLPWPLSVRSDAFRPIEGPLENMDHEAFGFFEFNPAPELDLALVKELVRQAQRTARHIDAVVLPEAAVDATEVTALEETLSELGVFSLVAGVREGSSSAGLGRNYVHLGVRTRRGWECLEQAKHHRWCLDGSQIRQYHLTRSLNPSKQWWEGIDLPARTLQVIDVGGGATTAPLICEDLARLDEVADLLRRIGPSLVVALLLDGPQLARRWPCRYATVLADEPGSAVLTLTSFGMAARSRPSGSKPSRAVALWSDSTSGLHELELGNGASGILLTASVGAKTVWTGDGRRHGGTPDVVLSGVHQLRADKTHIHAEDM